MRDRIRRSAVVSGLLVLAAALPAPAADPDPKRLEFFESKIRPVLVKHCYSCHSPGAAGKKVKGGLRVDSRDGLAGGGDTGPAVVPGDPAKSLLVRALKGDGVERMPPAAPLPAAVVADFERWVRDGAVDPRTAAGPAPAGIDLAAARKHWAFQPVTAPAVPPVRYESWPKGDVDRFVLAKLDEKGFRPTPPADRRTLARRAFFDLTGLPPTPEEMDAFLKDRSPDAYRKLVDQLLASPHYGEKWGRHWLDVVRYADTAGETADFPVPAAWRYRNYVIGAFNADKPIDQFLREQVAGDVLARTAPRKKYAELVTATGYLAISRRFGFDVRADQYLTIEDTIDTLGKSVLGLTLGCARCHDHKYDPVPTTDYYALYGIFESTKYAVSACEKDKRQHDLVPLVPAAEYARSVGAARARVARIDAELPKLREEIKTLSARLAGSGRQATRVLAAGEFDDGGAADLGGRDVEVRAGQLVQLVVLPRANHGADSTLVELAVKEQGGRGRSWAVTDDVIDDLLAANPHGDRYGNPGTWGFVDLRGGPSFLSESVRGVQGHAGLHSWRNGDTPSAWVNAGKDPVKVWTTLPPRTFYVHPAPDGPVGVVWVSPITGTVRVTGRVADAHKGGGDGVGWRLEHVAADTRADYHKLAAATDRLRRLSRERAEADATTTVDVAYAVAEGVPHDAELHRRGEPTNRGAVIPRKWLSVLGGQPVPRDGGSGRLALAGWLTDPANPLTARVFVNRVWQYHFGRGIVDTPNDFGTRGGRPSHPELLDHLAFGFMKNGWSVKWLHRQIMLSATYQQASPGEPPGDESGRAQKVFGFPLPHSSDPDNVWLSHFARRRLTAEEIRDAILAVSGDLDRTPGGPHPFPEEKGWGFTQHGPFSAVYDHDRRSVYLMTQRIKRHPFLGLFDGADPNRSTDRRDITTVPTQALFFLNDPFVHSKSARLADRLMASPDPAARLDRLYRLAYGRPPTPDERRGAARFLAAYGAQGDKDRDRRAWAAWVRVVFASNEFLYVD